MSIIVLGIVAIAYFPLPLWVKAFISLALGFDIAVAIKKADNK